MNIFGVVATAVESAAAAAVRGLAELAAFGGCLTNLYGSHWMKIR